MTKNEIAVLAEVVNGRPFWGMYNNTFGLLARNAASYLASAGLVRIIELGNATDSRKHYVAIPPNAEWDFKNMNVRSNA
jgi:hypothetical protein